MKYITALMSASLLTLSACSSDDSNCDDLGSLSTGSSQWSPGCYRPASEYKNQCEVPRSGIHPYTNEPFPDRPGSTLLENHYLRSWSFASYLWYDELPDLNPANYSNPIEYFALLKTDALTANGTPKDKFHFTEDEVAGDQLTYTGERGGFGISWTYSYDEGHYFALFTEANSPAEIAGVTRGMKLTHINGIEWATRSTEEHHKFHEYLFAPELGKSYNLQLERDNTATSFDIIPENVAVGAVHTQRTLSTESGLVGYLAFNTFNTYVAEDQLKIAFEEFAEEGITDLILDLRYNGGGYVHISSQLGFLIAGDNTLGETYSVLKYNDKRSHNNYTYPFYNATSARAANGVEPLTSVNLNRVYIIAAGGTCSASEALINGLRGIGVEVIMIGSKTCGKAHGFNSVANCGTRYFSIDFEIQNGQGFGEYSDGFEPAEVGDAFSTQVTGCPAQDDLAYALGDTQEEMLKTALYHRNHSRCPSADETATLQTKGSRPSIKVSGDIARPESDSILKIAP